MASQEKIDLAKNGNSSFPKSPISLRQNFLKVLSSRYKGI